PRLTVQERDFRLRPRAAVREDLWSHRPPSPSTERNRCPMAPPAVRQESAESQCLRSRNGILTARRRSAMKQASLPETQSYPHPADRPTQARTGRSQLGKAPRSSLQLTQYGFKRQANAESIVGIRISKGNPVHTG